MASAKKKTTAKFRRLRDLKASKDPKGGQLLGRINTPDGRIMLNPQPLPP